MHDRWEQLVEQLLGILHYQQIDLLHVLIHMKIMQDLVNKTNDHQIGLYNQDPKYKFSRLNIIFMSHTFRC